MPRQDRTTVAVPRPGARRVARIGRPRGLIVLIALGFVPGCGPDEPKPPVPVVGPRTSSEQVTITQIQLAYRRSGGLATATRTKEEARTLAASLIARIREGTSIEKLVEEYTDDRGDDGKPYNSGWYTFARSTRAVESLKRAAFGLDLGQLAPDPIDSGYAYHVIRRDN